MPRPVTHDRAAALDAAMALFWVRGYHATSLKDLEAALNMRPGSIYAAFRSKEGLYRAALDLYAGRMQAELRDLALAAPAPLAALQAHLRAIAGQSCGTQRPSSACMLVKALLDHPQEGALRDLVLTHLDGVEQILAEAFARAGEMGELPRGSDPARLARRMQTYVFGLKIQAQRGLAPEAMQRLCDDLAAELGALVPA
ncbi:TetR/AcrR family transcriptional regulator [Mangrovicoccus algicola]|uniref:Helix-turn-helix transcriptional regulator n=1 Tax=Mangrovicoccus algicola TaxID=2771008 RepID=A0A8J6YWL2_9RHOB|nr:TetR/AcrR family transcriptional regulator [Mangrovicoccus algicola]MBE3637594.1 helix-turn-helix transcriptional regulator [Mangrovicoccus algicola]